MDRIEMAKKGLYVGTGIGLILFVLIGLLAGSFAGGMIGLKMTGVIFANPAESSLIARVLVTVSMIIGVVASAIVCIAGTGFFGWCAGFAFNAVMNPGAAAKTLAVKSH